MGLGGKLLPLLVLAALVSMAAGCGSNSKSKSAATPRTPTTTTSAGGAAATSGSVHATFHGANHTPIVGKPWAYSVHVTDAAGHRLSGTVKIQFAFGGQVVGTDKPPVHPVRNGLWHDNLTYPKDAVGYPLTLQAVVHTRSGSVTLNWPVTVRK